MTSRSRSKQRRTSEADDVGGHELKRAWRHEYLTPSGTSPRMERGAACPRRAGAGGHRALPTLGRTPIRLGRESPCLSAWAKSSGICCRGQTVGRRSRHFAYHAHALGAEARLVSRIGRDALGEETLERLKVLACPPRPFRLTWSCRPGPGRGRGGGWPTAVHDPRAVRLGRPRARRRGSPGGGGRRRRLFWDLGQRDPRSRTTLRSLLPRHRRPPSACWTQPAPALLLRELIEESLALARCSS